VIKLFLLLSLICSAGSAEDSYELMGQKVAVYDEETLRITASVSCEPSKDKKECKNFKFLKKVSVRALGRTPAGNPNTGALICEDQLEGKSVVGKDASGNERSFCHLPKNNLYISNGTLSYWGNKNDGAYNEPETYDFGP
jgi:hypothetical protein